MKGFRKFTLRMIAGANVATIAVMLMVGWSGLVNPVSHAVLANAGLAFPAFLLVNFAFLVLWVIIKPKGALIPLLGYLLCYHPVRAYIPFNVQREAPEGSVKVLSYNVWMFSGWEDRSRPNPIARYLLRQNADIVCLQEATPEQEVMDNLRRELGRVYQYSDTSVMESGGDMMLVYSKYPIKGHEQVPYASVGNHSAAFKIDVDGQEVIVINNHLESIGFTDEDKKQFKSLVKGKLEGDTAQQESRRIIDKLADASAIRAPQADAVARYIARNAGKSIICVGDFNDGPLSYARRKVATDLTDCYIESANGPGISYHKSGFYVRIDNILCSPDWQPYGCKVDNSIKSSDHYPIYCWLKKRPKP